MVAVVLSNFPLVVGSFQRAALKQAEYAATEKFGDMDLRQYQSLAWLYGAFFVLASSGSAYSVFLHPPAWEVFTLAGIQFALIGILGLCDVIRSRVTVRGSRVEYRRLFSKSSFDLVEIRSVWAANGNVIVDLGRIPRVVIPTIFKDSGKLIALLRHYRPTSGQSTTSLEN